MRTNSVKFIGLSFAALLLVGGAWSTPAGALELNWSGQFWSEVNFIKNYSLDSSDSGASNDTTRAAANGYYISGGGSNNATFESLFLRVRPKLVVNDNIYIKSEWWLGDPVFGIFGNAVPYTIDQAQFYSNQSRGSSITAQRYWAEFLSDLGTVQVGRAPLEWGLGVVWNSGEELWSRYATTGDTIRMISKFGAFSFSPSFVLYSTGNSVGGSCNMNPAGTLCTPGQGSGAVTEYSLALKYENLEEDLDAGVNFIKRLAGSNQDGARVALGPSGTPVSFNYNIWDLYAKKKIGRFTFGGELPISTGGLAGVDYSAWALATEIGFKASDTWELNARAGHAPGQTGGASATVDKYKAFFFNPNYHLGMIMFNYQLANFSGVGGPNTLNNPTALGSALRSPYDNPITNANYLQVSGLMKTQKWTFNAGLVYATAMETAKASDGFFYNTVQRKMVATGAGAGDQSTSLGTEFDLGAAFQWDDYFVFRLDTGFWFPGDFWRYSNTAVPNATDMVWATSAKVGVTF